MEEQKKTCKNIWVSGEKYIGDILGYEIFVVGYYFDTEPEKIGLITEDLVKGIIQSANHMRYVVGQDPYSSFDRGATRGYHEQFKYSFHWEDKQLLIMDAKDG